MPHIQSVQLAKITFRTQHIQTEPWRSSQRVALIGELIDIAVKWILMLGLVCLTAPKILIFDFIDVPYTKRVSNRLGMQCRRVWGKSHLPYGHRAWKQMLVYRWLMQIIGIREHQSALRFLMDQHTADRSLFYPLIERPQIFLPHCFCVSSLRMKTLNIVRLFWWHMQRLTQPWHPLAII